ncbi:guanylate cyclase 32E-like [Halyomorpha halys]|uniref:guanylate cyclase 32E-like n=1 Tax=Halyomorpha halys TaxID=286706 RepID=UPI0034D2B7A6
MFLYLLVCLAAVISCGSQAPNAKCPMPENESDGLLYQYPTERENNSLTIGFLGAYSQKPVFLGALPLAVKAVNSDKKLLPGRRLGFLAANIGSSAVASPLPIRIMTQMRDQGTVAFIGPDGTCSAEALVAAAWNLPIISYANSICTEVTGVAP